MTVSHRLLGAFLIALTIVTALLVAPGTSIWTFLDIPSLAWIIGIVAGGLLVGFPLETISRTLQAAFRPAGNLTPYELQQSRKVLNSAYQLSWGAGIVGSLFGIILMLGRMSDPSRLGPGIAISLLMLFYAGLLAEIVIAGLQQSLEEAAEAESAESPETSPDDPAGGRKNMYGKVLAVTLLILVQFSILAVSLSTEPGERSAFSWMTRGNHAFGPEDARSRAARNGEWYSFISADEEE